MKHNHIRDTVDAMSPSGMSKVRIYDAVIKKQSRSAGRASWGRRIAIAAIAGAVLIAAAGVLLTQVWSAPDEAALSAPGQTTSAKGSVPSAGGSESVATHKAIAFKGFVLTAYSVKCGEEYLNADYAEDAQQQVLVPEVKVLLAKYSLLMSSVPGLPFTVDTVASGDAEAIRVSVDWGTLNEWDRETGVVTSEGESVILAAGETIYWSPFPDQAAAVATITVEAVRAGVVVGRQQITIAGDSQGYYTAAVGELEML